MGAMLTPISRPIASVGLEHMGPPGARKSADPGEVFLGTTEPAPEVKPTGPRGWRRAAVLGMGILSLAGALATLGPSIGPAVALSQQSPQEQIVAMATQPGLTPATPEERATLLRALKPVNPQVISLLYRNGLQIEVVHPGQDLTRAGVLRDQSHLEDQADRLRSFTADLQSRAEQRFGGRIRQLEGERDRLAQRMGLPQLPGPLAGMLPLGIGGFGAQAPKLTPDQEKLRDLNLAIGKLSSEKNAFVLTETWDSGLSLKPFSYPVNEVPTMGGGLLGGGMSMAPMLAMQAQMPLTMLEMARAHGCKTPEQFAKFYKLMELVNGDQLKAATQEATGRMMDLARLQKMDPARVQAAAARHPEALTLDHRKFNLLVPNMIFTPVGDKTLALDEHDWGVVQRWTESGTGLANTGRDKDGQPDGTMGQYFFLGDVNKILVRDFRLSETTPVHEVGHALDFLVKKLDPTWHKAWFEKVCAGFDKVGTENGPQAITDYSRTNVGEYVADGFMMYHTQPEQLKARDPELYDRIGELIKKAEQLSRPASDSASTLGALLQRISKGGA